MIKNIIFISSLMMLVFNITSAKTHVSGIITKDCRWNAEDGPFIIDSDILISSNTRLTISAGTKIFISNKLKPETIIPQLDAFDSVSIAIKVEGTLICRGKQNKGIIIQPLDFKTDKYAWYGIVFNKSQDQFTDIAYTEIRGAYCAITIKKCSPAIRNSVLEYNHIGINCLKEGSAKVFNCIIAHNLAAGIRIYQSNPYIANNAIIFNRNNGIWCDGISRIKLEYNCIFGNDDGNILDCDPELGILIKMNKNGDSVDIANNIFKDPVFAGSISDSIFAERDLSQPTNKSKIKDPTFAKILNSGRQTTPPASPPKIHPKYSLSRYSPCINAGNPTEHFHDIDGSRNDIGIGGGPELMVGKD
jgi:hypothetical protein